jgi:hypothetical protein
MELRISGTSEKVSPQLRGFIQRRMDIALGRFAPRIRSVSVALGDLNGPRGGSTNAAAWRRNWFRRG